VRYAITAGEPVTRGGLVSPDDRGFLAAALGAGMRAVTVSVSATTGVAGFVFPGDRVDMMLTQSVSGNNDGQDLKTTETILRNLRVLATDQFTETTTTPDGKTEVRASRTVTLEVTPRIAEKIQVAETIGTISLALRSIADNQSELERAIASGEDLPDNVSKEDEDRALRRIAARPQDGATSFVTGGDVSRFQRSSMPRNNPQGGAADGAPAALAVPLGPTVRVTRGKETSVTAVDRGAGAMLDRQAQGVGSFGSVSGAGLSTLR
jgi:pilus assembly protein CpaB